MRRTIHTLIVSMGLMAASAFALADDYGDVNKLIRNGLNADAISKADAYLSSKPKDPQMRFLKGIAQNAMGKTAEAITTLNQLIEDFPELPEPYNNLGVIYANQGLYDKARAALEMAVRNNPNYAVAHENLGDIYARMASQSYGKSLQLDPSNTAVLPKLKLVQDLFARPKAGKSTR
jgi:tetratricopeptide (TPR) repeat protein